jgi:TonB family protein
MFGARSIAFFVLLTLSAPAAAQSLGAGAILGMQPAMPLLIDSSKHPPAPPDTVVGSMLLELVVGETGRVEHLRVGRGLSPGVDLAASAAVRQWRFRPAVRSRRPVAAIVHLELTFQKPESARGPRDLVISLKPPPRVVPPGSVNVEVVPPATTGLVNPRVLRPVSPYYPDAAARVKAQGEVELDVVVMPDGTVGAAKIRKSLDKQGALDQEALVTAGYWLFQPATLKGKPVATTIRLTLAFRMS